jgi:hypothetical protein
MTPFETIQRYNHATKRAMECPCTECVELQGLAFIRMRDAMATIPAQRLDHAVLASLHTKP